MNLYLPGDDLLDQALAEYMGFFWCRYQEGLVAGERVVRFLMSPKQFEEAKTKYGPSSIGVATGQEVAEQLAYKSLPSYHSDRNAIAEVEARLYSMRMWELYVSQLRSALKMSISGLLTAEQNFMMITADARARSTAAYLVIDGQRPKQQALFG